MEAEVRNDRRREMRMREIIQMGWSSEAFSEVMVLWLSTRWTE
jgi:hypothetical protein